MKNTYWAVGVMSLFLVACGGQPPADGNGPPVGIACEQTLAGDILAPTSLRNLSGRAEGCDYFIPNPGTGDHTVRVTAALDVGPGTVIRVAENVRIRIGSGGSITTRGTESERVVLTGATAEQGSWYGLCFADDYGNSSLDHADIRWAGNLFTGAASSSCNGGISGASDARRSGTVDVTNSLIFGSYTSGVSTFGLNLGTFRNNVLAGNRLYGANVTTNNLSRLEQGDYLGTSVDAPNGEPYILAYGTLNEAASTQLWRKLNAPYFVTRDGNAGNILLNDGVDVEIEPGVTFIMDEGTSLSIEKGSSVSAEGTEAEPITFRGVENTPGFWNGIWFRGSGSSILRHAEVAWAGGDPDALAFGSLNLNLVGGTGDIELHDVTVRGSSTCGIWASDPGSQGVILESPQFPDHNDEFDFICGPFQPAGD